MTFRDEFDSDQPEGVWSHADKLPAKWREFRGWPPVDIPMQMPIMPSEVMPGMQWPPSRFWQRNERLAMWRRVWLGDLTDFIGVVAPKQYITGYADNWRMTEDLGAVSGAPVVINYPRRYIQVTSSLMMTQEPPDDINEQINETITHTMRDGQGYVIKRGDKVEAVEDMFCYETEGMWTPESGEGEGTLYVVRPKITPGATWDQPDKVEVIAIGKGIAATWEAQWSHVWNHGQIGAQTAPARIEAGVWAKAHNPPSDRGHGQSAIQDLVPPTAEIALRLTGADRILAAHEAPTLLVPIPNADIGSMFAVNTESGDDPVSWYGKKIAGELVKRLRDHNVAWRPDGIGTPEYLTWDGNLADSFMLMEILKGEVRMLTGLPASLEQEGGDVPSGSALAQMMVLLWATTKQLHKQVHRAYETVYGKFQWDNAFEAALAMGSQREQIGAVQMDAMSAVQTMNGAAQGSLSGSASAPAIMGG